MSGSTGPNPANVPKPQSVPAMTRSRPTIVRETQDALGDQLGMLYVVRRRAEHAGHEDLVVRHLLPPEYRPLVRMARVGGLEQQRLRLGLEHDGQQLLERDVVVVRPLVVAPADVHAHAIGRDVAQRMVEHLDVPRRGLQVFVRAGVRYIVWRPMPKSGASI